MNEENEEMEKYHVHLDDYIGVEKLSSKQLEDLEFLIGNLNEILESMFKCRICYDRNIDIETQEEMEESEENTINGFAIHVVEDEKENEDDRR